MQFYRVHHPPFQQARKPLVEKKRRARINESLQELRILLSDTDVSFQLMLTSIYL